MRPTGGDTAARLRSALVRLQTVDPFQILEIPVDAEGEAVRGAYLGATKKYHPTLFARDDEEVQKLAHELFLMVRWAYLQLMDEIRRKDWHERLAPALKSAASPTAQLRQAALAAAASGSAPTPAAAGTTPPSRVGTPETGTPVVATPSAAVQTLIDAARGRGQRLDEAVRAIAEGRYGEAKAALFKLVSEDPQNRRARVQLHLAGGLEHRASQRFEEAIRTLERAVALDPDCREAADALRKLQEQKKAGVFSKGFGR